MYLHCGFAKYFQGMNKGAAISVVSFTAYVFSAISQHVKILAHFSFVQGGCSSE